MDSGLVSYLGFLPLMASLAVLVFLPDGTAALHHRRQMLVIDRCRELYLEGTQALLQGNEAFARERLTAIEKLEARWRYWRSWLGVSTVAVASGLLFGVLWGGLRALALYLGVGNGYWPGDPIAMAVEQLQYCVPLGFLLVVVNVQKFRPWFEIVNFAERLRKLIYAGRDIVANKRGKARTTLDGLNARQVLGLAIPYTADDVRKAWRKLAAKYHPDRHMQASKAQRRAMEAAFERATAARDELLEGLA